MSTFEANECTPTTLFPMGVSCFVVQPSSPEASDGAVSLVITGGTPPYKILWDNSNTTQTINNLSAGSYGATVTDTYGDFSAQTVCVLTGTTPNPSPTPTPTPTPIPSGPNFCMSFFFEGPFGVSSYNIHFNLSGYVNGKPSWVSDDTIYTISWDTLSSTWIVSGGTLEGTLTNPNPVSPPINNNDWIVIGAYGEVTSIVEGLCEPLLLNLNPLTNGVSIISSTVSKNDSICGCDGSIMINVSGGYPPYQFSIDGGIIYQGMPIFNKLCQGSYNTVVRDSSGFTQVNAITINPPKAPTTYVVNLSNSFTTSVNSSTNVTKNYTTQVVINPPLPYGTVVEFDLVHTNTHETSPMSGSSTNITNSELTKNLSVLPYSYTSVTTGTSFNTIDGCQNQNLYIVGLSQVWQNLTMMSGDTITINTTTALIKNENEQCYLGISNDVFSIANLKIYGCSCCSVQNISV